MSISDCTKCGLHWEEGCRCSEKRREAKLKKRAKLWRARTLRLLALELTIRDRDATPSRRDEARCELIGVLDEAKGWESEAK